MKNFLVLLILAFVLSACGNVEEAQGEVNQETTEAIVAEVTMPEEAETGYQVLETQVTQAGEAVSSADEVIFEVWKHGDKENSEMIEQENEEDGIYSVGYIFENDGIYLVQPHVTAREMHTMPVHTIVVGDVNQEEIDAFDEYEVEKGSNSMDDHNHEHEYRHNADHDHSSGLDILMTIDNELNPSVISAKLNMEGKNQNIDPSVTIISKVLKLIDEQYKSNDLESLIKVIEKIIIPIYKNLKNEHKQFITDIVLKYFQGIKTSANNSIFNDSDFYYKALIYKLIVPIKEINEMLIKKVKEDINEYEDTQIFSDSYERNLFYIADLYRNGYILLEELKKDAESLKGYSEYFDLIVLKDAALLSSLSIIKYLKEEELTGLMENSAIRDKVYELAQAEYVTHNNKRLDDLFNLLYNKSFK